MFNNKYLTLLITFYLSCFTLNVMASNTSHENYNQRPEVKKFIRETAKKYNLSQASLSATLRQAKYNPEALAKMEAPLETKAQPWEHYRNFFITQDRINAGVLFWKKYRKILAAAQDTYGVPAETIVAILGIETKYGQNMGNFRVLDVLTTLAFDYPPRAAYFQNELAAFLVLCREKNLNPQDLYGSYAGAMGMMQFMPSSLLYYAIGYSDPKHPDIYANGGDAAFSVANYLMQKGWERDEPVATPAEVTGDQYPRVLKTNLIKPQEPTMTLMELQGYGVTTAGNIDPNYTAYLLQLPSQNQPEYWLAFHNFYVITLYNKSDLYALTVYQFGKKLRAAYEDYMNKLDQQEQLKVQ